MTPLLQVRELRKAYNVPVLVDFSFELQAGEVHALVGSNGAGKSTFARILAGLTQADAGQVELDAKPHAPASKHQAEAAGVVMVLQELNVVPTLTVAENLFLNRLPRRAGFVRFKQLQRQAAQALTRVGLGELDPSAPAGGLGVGQQQLIEIAGALAQSCRLLILDEPTAALTDPEIERLFSNIRRLQTAGVGIIYISHRMDEIRKIADRVTVLRDGRRIATHAARETTPADLVRDMVGHDLPDRGARGETRQERELLRVQNLHAGEIVRGVSFHVRAGEILGLAGLIGSGRTETLRGICGADPKRGGQVFVAGQPVEIREPADAVRVGIGMVPEDRKQHALLAPHPVRANMSLATLTRHARAGWLNLDSERTTARQLTARLGVRCASIEQAAGELSGGNQQKVVVARWLARNCRVLLFDEPTRGIDVAAKDLIYDLLRQLAAEGKAVVVVSSDLTELMAIAHRIAVMSAGKIAAEFEPGEWSQQKLTEAAFSGYLRRQPEGQT